LFNESVYENPSIIKPMLAANHTGQSLANKFIGGVFKFGFIFSLPFADATLR
jgi:hypothetical protein